MLFVLYHFLLPNDSLHTKPVLMFYSTIKTNPLEASIARK